MTSWFQTPYGESWNLNAFRGFVKRTKQKQIQVVGFDGATGKPQVIYQAVDHEEANTVLESIARITGAL